MVAIDMGRGTYEQLREWQHLVVKLKWVPLFHRVKFATWPTYLCTCKHKQVDRPILLAMEINEVFVAGGRSPIIFR